MSDARNQFGHYLDGHSLADVQKANVLPEDDRTMVNWKIEQKKSEDLAEYLVKYGPGPARSSPQRKGRWGVFLLGMLSLAPIGYYTWRVFVYSLENYALFSVNIYSKMPKGFLWKISLLVLVLGGIALTIWLLSLRFFRWLCYENSKPQVETPK